MAKTNDRQRASRVIRKRSLEKDEAPSEATNRDKRTSYEVRRPCLPVRVFAVQYFLGNFAGPFITRKIKISGIFS